MNLKTNHLDRVHGYTIRFDGLARACEGLRAEVVYRSDLHLYSRAYISAQTFPFLGMLITLASVIVKPKDNKPFVHVLDRTVQVTISITTGRTWLRASPISAL
jgi:hypothetical protein